MRKSGPDAASEGSYCAVLGPRVCPEVYELGRDSYTMELLRPAHRVPGLLREIESLLRERVWSRTPSRESRDEFWTAKLFQRTGIVTPPFAEEGVLCRTHGDCTTSNALRRDNGELVIGDPAIPRPHVARFAEADMGRLLQSALGWEVVAHDEELVEWEEPKFWRDPFERRRAIWWCGVTAVRIRRDWSVRCPHLLSERVQNWISRTAEVCLATSL